MSGDSQSKVNELWEQTEKTLLEYRKKLCLTIQMNPQAEQILSMREVELNALDSQTRDLYSYLLMQHSLYIQQEFNYHATKHTWAKHNLEITIGKLARNYGDKWTKWEEKKVAIINENSFAKVLSDMIRETSIYMELLNFVSKKIESMSHILRRRND